ncbi:MAG: hypothetical protein INQ03_25975 [Candidatus Heimdallarchaeota archaeon]|nr:hypothetical protein [Candidatus Heimdallarchaeota archaeon]
MRSLTPSEVNRMLGNDEVLVIDVREKFEIEAAAISNFIHIPMLEIPDRLDELPRDKDIAVLCHTGSRSGRVTLFLHQMGFLNVSNIQGGIERWALQTDPSLPRYRKFGGKARII